MSHRFAREELVTDREFLLLLLRDGHSHCKSELEQRSLIELGHRMTVHSRVAELRRDGWMIDCTPVPHLRESIYTLSGKVEGRYRVKDADPVQAYMYVTDEEGRMTRDRTVCKIIGRAKVSDAEARDYGPAFRVQFGDGHITTAYSDELRPWYPV